MKPRAARKTEYKSYEQHEDTKDRGQKSEVGADKKNRDFAALKDQKTEARSKKANSILALCAAEGVGFLGAHI